MGTSIGILGVFAVCLGVVLAILWICLPFAVFGLKDILKECLVELKGIRAALERIK